MISHCMKKRRKEKALLPCTASLCLTVLYCTVLYCTVLYCRALNSTPMYCNLLYSFIPCSTELYCDVLHCTELYFLHCTDEKYKVYYDDNHLNATTVLCLGEFSSTCTFLKPHSTRVCPRSMLTYSFNQGSVLLNAANAKGFAANF